MTFIIKTAYPSEWIKHTIRAVILIALFPVLALSKPDAVIQEVSGVTQEDMEKSQLKNQVSLFDAYVLAVKNTETLPMSREDLRQAHSRRHQAIGTVLPRLSIQGNVVFPQDKTNKISSQTTSVSLYAKQTLITGLNELSSFKGSSHEIRIKRYELSYNAAMLLRDVALTFYQVLQLEKSIKNNEQILDLYKKTINELNRRVAMGKSRESEVLKTSSQMYKIQADIKSQQSSLMEMRLELFALAGVPVEAVLVDEGGIPGPTYQAEALDRTIEGRWDIKAAREEIGFAQAGMLGAIGANLPSVYLEGSYRIYQESPATGREFYGSLGFELPIISGDVPGRVEETWSKKKQAELGLSKSMKNAEYEIRDSYQAWQSTTGEIDSYRNALEAAENNYQATMREYRLNLVTILDVLTALTSLQTSRNDYETIVIQNRFNRIRLGVAVNEFPGAGMTILKNAFNNDNKNKPIDLPMREADKPGPGGQ